MGMQSIKYSQTLPKTQMLQNLTWEGADIYKSDKDYILHFTMKMPETTLTRIF